MCSNRLFITLIFILNLFTSTTYAQGHWQWGRSSVPANTYSVDPWAARIDDSGNVVVTAFSNIIYGAGIDEFVVYGRDTIFNHGHIQQGIVVKSDSNGHLLWAKGSQLADNWPFGMVTDHSGNIYVFGMYSDYSSCGFDTFTLTNTLTTNMYYLVKYSPGGQVLWAKNVLPTNRFMGAGSMCIDAADNMYLQGAYDFPTVNIGGTTLTNTSHGTDTFDVFLAKYDNNGNPIWAKSFGGEQNDVPGQMSISESGKIYLAGSYYSRTFNAAGHTLTNTLMGSTGYPMPLTYLIKTDTSGHIIWANNLSKKINLNQIINDPFENLYMIGNMDSTILVGHDTLVSNGSNDWFFGKFDSSGTAIWARNVGSTMNDYGLNITLDDCNHIWITGGAYRYATSFNFGDSIITIPSGCFDPGIIAEYTDSGSYIFSMKLNSGGDDMLFLLPNKGRGFYLAGDFVSSDMPFGPDTLVHYAAVEALFIAKFNSDSCYIGDGYIPLSVSPANQHLFTFNLFPNPTSGEFSVVCSATPLTSKLVQISDLVGRVIKELPLKDKTTSIKVDGLVSGMYICKIIAPDGQVAVKKLILEK